MPAGSAPTSGPAITGATLHRPPGGFSPADRRRPDGPRPSGTEPEAGTGGAGRKRSRWKKIAVVAAVVVVAAAAAVVVKGRLDKPVYGPGQPVPDGQVVSLGTLTVALADGHLVQAAVDLQMTKPANLTEESDDSAHLKNEAVALLGQQTYTGLLPATGRTALQGQLLTSFRQVLGKADGAEQVGAVYFTGFVLQ